MIIGLLLDTRAGGSDFAEFPQVGFEWRHKYGIITPDGADTAFFGCVCEVPSRICSAAFAVQRCGSLIFPLQQKAAGSQAGPCACILGFALGFAVACALDFGL